MTIEETETVGAGVAQGGFIVAAIALPVLFLTGVPVIICTLLAALRGWRHWHTALAGGMAATAIGIALGGVAAVLIHLLA